MSRLLITGGAGFIGVNAAASFDREGWSVLAVDNLSRRGAARNQAWLAEMHPAVRLEVGDVRDAEWIRNCVRSFRPDVVLHLAAQVAVTTSVAAPREDFSVNALGTFNVLEAIRQEHPDAFCIFASTNKVYGSMENVQTAEGAERYSYVDLPFGCSEKQPLDFHTPYGCSKGAGDLYCLDYARIYGLDTVSLRQSCIYGPHQMGVEDQGWVAWFCIAAALDKELTIYGDGKQVRDLLHVDDLLLCYRKAIEHRSDVRGRAFNVGGGPENTLSLLELLSQLESLLGRPIPRSSGPWRCGDQRVFIADIRAAKNAMGWAPRIGPSEGVPILMEWVRQNSKLFRDM